MNNCTRKLSNVCKIIDSFPVSVIRENHLKRSRLGSWESALTKNI